jgi:hypothetical protein
MNLQPVCSAPAPVPPASPSPLLVRLRLAAHARGNSRPIADTLAGTGAGARSADAALRQCSRHRPRDNGRQTGSSLLPGKLANSSWRTCNVLHRRPGSLIFDFARCEMWQTRGQGRSIFPSARPIRCRAVEGF